MVNSDGPPGRMETSWTMCFLKPFPFKIYGLAMKIVENKHGEMLFFHEINYDEHNWSRFPICLYP